MQFRRFELAGLVEMTPRRFEDERGNLMETFSALRLQEAGVPTLNWVQDNQSCSRLGVLRGLHFQKPPHAQAKLVRVASGRALDVVVDLRSESPTFGQHQAIELSAAAGNVVFIPAGFAHGFLALEENTLFLYRCSDYYAPQSEGGLRWNDPTLNISWGTELTPLISPKDAVLPFLSEFKTPF